MWQVEIISIRHKRGRTTPLVVISFRFARFIRLSRTRGIASSDSEFG
jgi:hypothetical protein